VISAALHDRGAASAKSYAKNDTFVWFLHMNWQPQEAEASAYP
jgi:hypothetical protein